LFVKPVVMRKIFFALCAAFIILSYSFISSQDISQLQEDFIEAEYFFMKGYYPDALQYYLGIYEKAPENANIAFRIGACYMNIPGQKNLAIDYLETASANVSAKHREGTITETSAPYDALYELARAYLINYHFDKAKDTFRKYSETLLPEDRENIDFINQQIKSCDIAKEYLEKPVSFSRENMGPLFNDEKNNFNPLISSDGKSFAYMVSLKFYDAIMLSKRVNGKWAAPVNITPELHSDGNMYISCLSSDGNTLYLSKNDDFNSDIFTSTFDGFVWKQTVKLNSNINTRYWESHGFVTEDGNTLIFASDRPGGFGGLDLYISKKENNDWGPPVNLGPEINTPFNEDRAFLINQGKTLFFSSQGHSTMGGYDIFRSDIQSNGLWSPPDNLGYPLNTPDDNIFFMPSDDGNSGYYTMPQEPGTEGKEDIFKITFRK